MFKKSVEKMAPDHD